MRSKRKIAAAALLAFIICLFAPGVSAFADGGTVVEVSSKQTLVDAFNSAVNSTNKVLVSLNNDIDWADNTECAATGLSLSNREVTLVGNGHTISNFTTISLGYGAVLNLGDGSTGLTISGSKYGADNTKDAPGILSLTGNAQCNMYNNVTLCNSERNNYYGGGVTIGGQSRASNKAVFHMYGGTINNCGVKDGSVCYGGGVAVCNGGTFIMDGGTISNCYANTFYNNMPYPYNDNATGCGGAVFVGGGSTFKMNGGSIENCSASSNGGGVAVYTSRQSGLGKLDSEFTMNGGTITGCAALGFMGGGVFATGRIVDPPAICAPSGSAGTVTNKGIHILGGTISNNRAAEIGGGIGLFLLRQAITVDIKNTTITGNSAAEGGGIGSLLYWTRFNIDNCSITGNNAQVGGGISVNGNDGSNGGNTPTATVINSRIGNNLADVSASDVYVYDANMTLCSADSGLVYTNTEPSDLTNRDIKQWYEDNNGDRFVSKDTPVKQETLNLVWGSTDNRNKYMLIAAPTSPDPNPSEPTPEPVTKTFSLTKGFVSGYDNAVGDIRDKLSSVSATFKITPILSFNSAAADIPAFDPDEYTININRNTEPDENGKFSIEITTPDYTDYGVGDYWYTITETGINDAAGLAIDKTPTKYLHVQVQWVEDSENSGTYNVGGKMEVAAVTIHENAPNNDGTYNTIKIGEKETVIINGTEEEINSDKTTGFNNSYSAGSLSITKEVTGNMSDPDKLFKVDITFTAPSGKTVQSPISYSGGFADDKGEQALNGIIDPFEYGSYTITVYLKDDTTVSFDNIPAGVTYTVVEDDYSADGYTTKYNDVEANSISGTINDSSAAVTITNTKTMNIDVGVTLDNAPFVILLAGGVVILAVLLLAKRRRKNVVDEDI